MAKTLNWRRCASAAAVFAVALLLFDRLLVSAIDGIDARLERDTAVLSKLAALPAPAAYEWLILGTSRGYEGIHPALIQREFGVRAFKEAYKGKGLRYQYEFYRLYRQVVRPPRVVVFTLDYFMFDTPSDPLQLRRLGPAGAPDGRARPAPWGLRLVSHRSQVERTVLRILERVQARIGGGFDPDHRVADMEAYTGEPVSRVVERAEPAEFRRADYRPHPGIEGEYFDRLIREWAAEGIVVVLVYPPDYVGTRETNVGHEAFIADVRRLVRACPTCSVLDYAGAERFPIATAKYFLDGGYGNTNSHLSQSGAALFHRVWMADVKEVLARLGVPAGRPEASAGLSIIPLDAQGRAGPPGSAGTSRRPSTRQPPSSTR